MTIVIMPRAFAVLACLFSVVFAVSTGHNNIRRHDVHHNVSVQNTNLAKRATGVRYTYFRPGLGACGGYNTENDFIVALSAASWDGGAHCGAAITISIGGKTAQATIVDMCMECPPNALDFSPSLFQYFASLDAGVLYGDWVYGNGVPAQPSPTPTPSPTPPPPPPTTSPTPTPTPEPTPTPTPTPSPSTSQEPTTTSTPSTTSTSTTPTPTATFDPSKNVLQVLNQAVIDIAALQAAAANAGNSAIASSPS